MKPPPNNPIAEEQILSCLLYEPKLIESLDGLSAEDFYTTSLSQIARIVINRLHSEATAKDISEVLIKSKNSGTYLELTNSIPRTTEFDKYVGQVKRASKLRNAINTLLTSAELIRENDDLAYDELSERVIGDVVRALDIDESRRTCFHVSEAMDRAYKRVLALHSGSGDEMALRTGFIDLDRMLSGMWPGDSVIIAGRPSMGKSAFALSVAINVAESVKRPVILFSLEMSNQLEANRILSFETEINSNHIRDGKVASHSLELLENAIKKYRDIPLYLDDKSSITIGHIRTVASRIRRECGDLALVVVDYMQLMGSSERNREREIAIISQSLKGVAKDFGIPVISLSQLNRLLESRTNKRPQLSDLRESGAIEQDADTVIFIYRDDYYNRESKEPGVTELIVGKNRSGPTGTVKVLFDRELTRFRNMENKHDQRSQPAQERNHSLYKDYTDPEANDD